MSISNLLNITNPEHYKLHVARHNQIDQPLDVFIRDKDEWNNWNCWISHKHEFNRQFILALINFYPQQDTWLYGGIYEVMGFKDGHDHKSRHCFAYNSVLTEQGKSYIGRLKVHLPMRVRGRVFNLEHRISNVKIQEITPQPYLGAPFTSYNNVSLNWVELSSIVKNKPDDWKTALSAINGIYLITIRDGRQYIGSAYGKNGIWGRWQSYAYTKDGGNKLMKEANDKSLGKFILEAKFTLLEAIWQSETEKKVIERESYWKNALGSRIVGLNSN